MAKVSDIKFEIKGTHYTVHVNCSSKGWFSANIPKEVAEALDIRAKLEANTLSDLEKEFHSAIDRYKKAETKQELFIAIKYLSSGRFSQKKDGLPLFGGHNNKYALSLSFQSNSINGLAFHFSIVIKETIDTIPKWFKAQQGKDFPHWDKEQNDNPEKWYKNGNFHTHSLNEWKFIPFSDAALNSLTNAQEKIRTVSEMLFNFIEQDEKKMELTLTKNKLLTL